MTTHRSPSLLGMLRQIVDFRPQPLLRDRAVVLPDNAPLLIDDERLGDAIDTEVDAHPPRLVHPVGERLLEAADELAGGTFAILDVHPDDHHAAVAVLLPDALQAGRFLIAGWITPGGPEVDHEDAAAQRSGVDGRAVKPRDPEDRRGAADQWRRQGPRVARKPVRQQGHDRQRARQRHQPDRPLAAGTGPLTPRLERVHECSMPWLRELR